MATPEPFTDDTHPVVTIRPEDPRRRSGWPGAVLLAGAVVLTLAAVALLLPGPGPAPTATDAVIADVLPTQTPASGDAPAQITEAITVAIVQPGEGVVPTVNSQRIGQLLQTPVTMLRQGDDGAAARYNPFTFIPDRPRSEFVQYTVVQGDTLDLIAQRYNLRPESLAWCNDRRIIFVLRPGDVLNIPPVDGACHVVLGTRNETISSVAQQYKVTPQDLINSRFGSFYDMQPDTVLPGGLNMFIPGGEGELITWNPPSEVERDSAGNVRSIAFAKGQAGSCGSVDPAGGAAWANPLPNGTWVRGFSVGHTGIDLSASVGTPVYAANSGPVLFSGFSSWGYGEAIVLAHGPILSTLYGHLSARFAACGQYINVGTVIGQVGSTGNSTGPHLHFEIRSEDTPQNPSGTPGIGW